MRKLFSKWMPRLHTPDQTSLVWSCSSKVKRILCVGMRQWMIHGSTTTHLKQKDRQLSGQQLVKAVQSDHKLNSGMARLWHLYYGSCMVFCLSTILRELIVHYVTRSQALPSSAEYALGSKLHTILYVREERFLHFSESVWYNISKSKNIWGRDFYRAWAVKLMKCAYASAGKVSFTVQVQ